MRLRTDWSTLIERMLSPVFVVFLFCSCTNNSSREPGNDGAAKLPPVMLWVWERPVNLEFLESDSIGVAFLSQTLVLSKDDVLVRPRRQPLAVSPLTKLVAVTRIESQKVTGRGADLSDSQRGKLASLILKTLDLPNVSGIQIDFDVALSERRFYRDLLMTLRGRLAPTVPLSITALASFCLGDRWMDGLPVDEAIPMIFRMGDDDRKIKRYLEEGGEFTDPLCRKSYGISLDEPLRMKFDNNRRLYIFNNKAWNETDLKSFLQSR